MWPDVHALHGGTKCTRASNASCRCGSRTSRGSWCRMFHNGPYANGPGGLHGVCLPAGRGNARGGRGAQPASARCKGRHATRPARARRPRTPLKIVPQSAGWVIAHIHPPNQRSTNGAGAGHVLRLWRKKFQKQKQKARRPSFANVPAPAPRPQDHRPTTQKHPHGNIVLSQICIQIWDTSINIPLVPLCATRYTARTSNNTPGA